MGNQNQYQHRQAPYQGNTSYQQRGNNAHYDQGWRPETGPSNRKICIRTIIRILNHKIEIQRLRTL